MIDAYKRMHRLRCTKRKALNVMYDIKSKIALYEDDSYNRCIDEMSENNEDEIQRIRCIDA